MFITPKTAASFRIYINTHSPSQCHNHRMCTVGFSRLGLMYLRIILVPVELFSAIVTKYISLYNYYACDNRPAPGSIGHTYIGPSSVSPKCQSARGMQGHSNKIKQEFGLTDFSKAFFRVNAGTKRRSLVPRPCYTPPFGLPYQWAGMQ